MPRIVSLKVDRIDLGNGEWVDVRAEVPYSTLAPLVAGLSYKAERGPNGEVVTDKPDIDAGLEIAPKLLSAVITAFCFRDEAGELKTYEGNDAIALIPRFDLTTTADLVNLLTDKYFVQKKSLPESPELSNTKVVEKAKNAST